MQLGKFLEHKIRRQIALNGAEFIFTVAAEDKYHQLTGETKSATIKGVYHESNSYIKESGSDSSTTRSKKSPMILAIMSEVGEVTQGWRISINGKDYSVSGILDVQNYGTVADISLEEVM